MEQGYVKTLPYLLGIFCGFSLVMLGTAAASEALANVVPELLPILKYAGAAYIAWLAWHFAKKLSQQKISAGNEAENQPLRRD